MMGYARNVEAQEAERDANGQYRIGSRIKVYNGDLKPIDAYFTYLPPSYQWKYKEESNKTVFRSVQMKSLFFHLSEERRISMYVETPAFSYKSAQEGVLR